MSGKWRPFDMRLGSKQELPTAKRCVLVQTAAQPDVGLPPGVAVGYLKFAAGDRNCPYFVTPGIDCKVVFWNDCLGDDFHAPLWRLPQPNPRSESTP